MPPRTKKPALRAVGPNETPPAPPKPLTLEEAIESGTYLDILVAQRADIVKSLPEEKGPARAALHRQLALISKEIALLQQKEAEDTGGGAGIEDEEFDASAI